MEQQGAGKLPFFLYSHILICLRRTGTLPFPISIGWQRLTFVLSCTATAVSWSGSARKQQKRQQQHWQQQVRRQQRQQARQQGKLKAIQQQAALLSALLSACAVAFGDFCRGQEVGSAGADKRALDGGDASAGTNTAMGCGEGNSRSGAVAADDCRPSLLLRSRVSSYYSFLHSKPSLATQTWQKVCVNGVYGARM